MRYLVAVSGGIDSVVLLDMLVRAEDHDLIVAHFDHGIRSDSGDDARFVQGLAAQYGVPFVTQRESLGKDASEDTARTRRYAFLRRVARNHNATIVTAHHADDVIETIAINLQRGTGWRGAAVLDTPEVTRPLLGMTKTDIRAYALDQRLEWVEDSTNAGSQYLRNRLRQRVARRLSREQKYAVRAIWQRQLQLKADIDHEAAAYAHQQTDYSRYYLTHIDEQSAVELLRAVIITATNRSLTRPQLLRGLLAIKTARPHSAYQLGAGVALWFNVRTFVVKTP